MGKLTDAIEATRKVRQNYKMKKFKISKRDQKIIDAIKKGEFGCQKENVFVFAEALLERKIPREVALNTNPFVKGALVKNKEEEIYQISSVSPVGFRFREPDGHENGYTGDGTNKYMRRNWKPATDKEIKDYFA